MSLFSCAIEARRVRFSLQESTTKCCSRLPPDPRVIYRPTVEARLRPCPDREVIGGRVAVRHALAIQWQRLAERRGTHELMLSKNPTNARPHAADRCCESAPESRPEPWMAGRSTLAGARAIVRDRIATSSASHAQQGIAARRHGKAGSCQKLPERDMGGAGAALVAAVRTASRGPAVRSMEASFHDSRVEHRRGRSVVASGREFRSTTVSASSRSGRVTRPLWTRCRMPAASSVLVG